MNWLPIILRFFSGSSTPLSLDKNIFDSKEFINYNDIEKNCNFVDFGYGINDFSGNFYGINDVNLVKEFFEKIKESNKLSFENDNFNLRKINAYLYMTEDDYKNDICINIWKIW